MIDLGRARALHAVATHGTVTAAAAALHVTSSALSQQLAKLEREIGQPLLVRRGRTVALTDAGHLLVGHTSNVLAEFTRAETALQAQRGQVFGRMALAAFATATRAVLPSALRRLRDHHPALQISCREAEPDHALALLVRGEVDLVVIDEWFASEPVLPHTLRAEYLCDDVADLALPVKHPLSSQNGNLELTAFAAETWISWGPGQFGHDWLQRALHPHIGDPKIPYTANEHQTLLALVAAGLGVALIPRLGRGPVPDGAVVKAVHPTATRRLFAVWHTDTGQRPAIHAACDALHHASATPPPGR